MTSSPSGSLRGVGATLRGQLHRLSPSRVRRKLRDEVADRTSLTYEAGRYERDFLGSRVPATFTFPVNHLDNIDGVVEEGVPRQAQPVMFAFWMSPTAPSTQRQDSLDALARLEGIDFNLVDERGFRTMEVESWPIHSAFDNLSDVHKSDYARAYVMHHYGGFYCDVKKVRGPVREALRRLNDDPSAWATGVRQVRPWDVFLAGDVMGRDLLRHYRKTFSVSCFACKPGTPLTRAWLQECDRRLSYYADLLERHPARDAYGREGHYPVQWEALLACILFPLQVRFIDHVLVDPDLSLDLTGYR